METNRTGQRSRRNRRARSAALLVAALSAGSAFAQSGTWTNPAGGTWGDATNWFNSVVATGASNTANFNSLNLTSDLTVTLGANQTIGGLTFNDTPFWSNNYTLEGNSFTLSLSRTTVTELVGIDVTTLNTATINAALDATSSAGIRKLGSGTLILNQAAINNGTFSMNQGTVVINNSQALGSGAAGVGTLFIENSNNNILSLRVGSAITSINQKINNQGGASLDIYGANNFTLNGSVIAAGGSRRLRNYLSAGASLNFAGGIETSAGKWELGGLGDSVFSSTISGGGNITSVSAGTTTTRVVVPATTALNVWNGTFLVDTSNGGGLAGTLTMGGGGASTLAAAVKPTLVVKGGTTGAALTPAGNFNIGVSDSRVILDANGGTVSYTVGGQISRGTSAGVCDIQIPASNGTFLVGTTGQQNGLFPGVTVNSGADFAASNTGVLGAYTGYVVAAGSITNSATTTFKIDNTSSGNVNLAAGTVSANAIAYKDSTARTIAVGPASTLALGTSGAILAAPGSGTLTIGAVAGTGRVTASTTANSEVLLIANSSNPIIVNSFVANNGATAVRLNKSGDGVAILNAANTYTGNTWVNGGTLKIGAAGALGPDGKQLFINSGTLDMNGFSQNVRELAGAGVLTNSSASAATLTLSNTAATNATNNIITGNITLVKKGNFQAEITNDFNDFTGGVVLNEGTIRINNAQRLGSGTIFFDRTTANPAVLYTASLVMPNTTSTNPYFVGSGGGTRKLENNWTHNGPIYGAGSLQLAYGFSPTLTLGGDNRAFTGTMLFDANSGNTGNVGLAFTTSNSGSPSALFDMRGGGFGGNVQWAGAGNGTIQLGAVTTSTTGAGTFSLRNTIAGTTAMFEIGGRAQDSTFGGTIVNNIGTSGIAKVGNKTLTLTNNNSYTGPTIVSAGTLVTNGTLGATPITVNGGVMQVNAATGNAPAIVNSGGGLIVNATTLGASSVTVNSGGALLVTGSGTIGTAGATLNTGISLAGGASASTRGSLSLVDGTINTLTIRTGNATDAHTALSLGNGTQSSSLSFEVGPSNTADKIQLADAVANVSASGTAALINVAAAAGWNGSGVYTLINAPGGGISASNFAMGTVPAGVFTYALSNPDASNLVLTVTGNAVPTDAYWAGDRADGVWAAYSPALPASGPYNTNWTSAYTAGTDPSQLPGGITNVKFAAAGAGSLTTTLGADFSINSLTFGSLTTGAVTVGGNNTLTVGAGGIVVESGSGAHNISATGLALGANQTWANNSTNPLTISSNVSGGFGLTIAGTGTGPIVLSGNNTYSGGTTINTGAVKLGSDTALGTGILTMNGGTLDLNNRSLAVSALGGNSGVIQNNASGAATLTFNTVSGGGASSNTAIANGVGTVTVVKNGSGTLLLTGTNSYFGGTKIGGGTLGYNADAALGAAAGSVMFTGAGTLQPSVSTATSISHPINLADSVTGAINTTQLGSTTGTTVNLNSAITGAGTFAKGGDGTLVLNSSGSTVTSMALVGGTTVLGVNDALTGSLTTMAAGATLDLNGKTQSAGTLLVTASGATITNSSSTEAVLTKNTTFATSAQATIFNVTGSGPIRIDSFWTNPASNPDTGYLLKTGSGTLTIGGGPETPSNSNNQTVVQVGGRPTVVNSVYNDFVPGGTVIVNKNSPTLAANALRFALVDSGTLVYGSNTIGATAIGFAQIGALRVGSNGVIDLNGASGLNATVENVIQTAYANTPWSGDTTFFGIADFGNGTILNNSTNAATLTVGANNGNGGAGSLAATTVNIRDGLGTLALVKIGSGTLALATEGGAALPGDVRVIHGNTGNTFSGGLFVNGGTLSVWSSGAAGVGKIQVASGANFDTTLVPSGFQMGANRDLSNSGRVYGTVTLAGSNRVSGAGTFQNDVTVQSGGKVAPGAGDGHYSTSTLTFAGNLSHDGGFAVDLNGAGTNSDLVNVLGSLNLVNGGTVDVNFTSAPTGLPKTYTIATGASKTGISFNNAAYVPNSRANVTFSESGSSLQVTVNSWTAGNLKWNSVGTSTWDVGNLQNWQNDMPAADKFFQLDNVTFDDTVGVSQTVNLSTAIAPGSMLVNTSSNAFALSGSGTLTGSGTVTKQGSKSLTIRAAANYTGVTTIQGGSVVMVGSRAWAPAVSLAGGADVQAGRLVLDYTETAEASPASTVAGLLTTSSNNGFVTGQLRSTTVSAGRGLGWVDTGTQVVVMATYLGDANLTGTVDSTDFSTLVGNYGNVSGMIWAQGDFNYDGKVNTLDFNYLAANFGAPALGPTMAPLMSGSSLAPVGVALGAVVPEPASMALLGMGVALLARRRK